MAIVQIAIADSVAAVKGGFKRYTSIPNAPAGASVDTAIATAATPHARRDVPVARRIGSSSSTRPTWSTRPGTLQQKAKGVLVGVAGGLAILALRQNDGSDHPEDRMGTDYIPGDGAGRLAAGPDQPGAGRPRRALGAR